MRLMTVLLLLVLTLPVRAQLGQTLEQCATRYGQPTSIEGVPGSALTGYHYSSKDYLIVIYFTKIEGTGDEIAAKIVFHRVDTKVLADKEIETLLAANAENGQWTKAIPGWARDDGGKEFGLAANSDHVDLNPVGLAIEHSDYEVEAAKAQFTTIFPELDQTQTNSP